MLSTGMDTTEFPFPVPTTGFLKSRWEFALRFKKVFFNNG